MVLQHLLSLEGARGDEQGRGNMDPKPELPSLTAGVPGAQGLTARHHMAPLEGGEIYGRWVDGLASAHRPVFFTVQLRRGAAMMVQDWSDRIGYVRWFPRSSGQGSIGGGW